MEIKLDVAIIKQEEFFVAYSPALELSAYGKTISDAKKDFKEVLELFIQDLAKDNKLIAELLDLGWTIKTKPQPVFKSPTIKKRELKKISAIDIEEESFLVPAI
ncbi:MAG: hypothetical protein HND52_01175 [Ignavibacteriae bacterium]|nr:hypothetical protein [Ignavibacteriota bacterium]